MARQTTTRTRRRLVFACAAGIVVLVAACGGSSDRSKTSELGDEEFGLTMKQLVARVEAVEQHIARCMSDAGFNYIANDFDTVRRAMKAAQSAPGLSEREFQSQFGFGITTQLEKPIVKLGLGEQNTRIRDSLSPTDQLAYDRTLLGEDTEAVFANALEEEDFSRTGGCTRAAAEKEFTKKEVAVAYINPADQVVDQDPRVIAAFEEYAACMERAGIEYRNPNEIEADLQERFDALTGGEDPELLDAAGAQELAALQDFERRAADVSSRCETRFVDRVTEAVEREIYGRGGD